jgi:hypothetical protein
MLNAVMILWTLLHYLFYSNQLTSLHTALVSETSQIILIYCTFLFDREEIFMQIGGIL